MYEKLVFSFPGVSVFFELKSVETYKRKNDSCCLVITKKQIYSLIDFFVWLSSAFQSIGILRMISRVCKFYKVQLFHNSKAFVGKTAFCAHLNMTRILNCIFVDISKL